MIEEEIRKDFEGEQTDFDKIVWAENTMGYDFIPLNISCYRVQKEVMNYERKI